MIRSAASKLMWVGRATVFLVGLAVILALVVGFATAALAGTGIGATFNLGKINTVNRLSQLVGAPNNAMLVVDNRSTKTDATALDLRVNAGRPPMKVNSSTMVDTLHAEYATYVDGKRASDFAPKAVEAWHEVGASNQPAFTNGWTNFGDDHSTAAFYKDPWGVVHLKGVVQGGTVAHAPSGSVFTLPCGYGPGKYEVHSVLSNDAAGRVSIFFGPCGGGQYSAQVVAAPPSNKAWVSLDGITFRAAGS